jgi:hypothetical protein
VCRLGNGWACVLGGWGLRCCRVVWGLVQRRGVHAFAACDTHVTLYRAVPKCHCTIHCAIHCTIHWIYTPALVLDLVYSLIIVHTVPHRYSITKKSLRNQKKDRTVRLQQVAELFLAIKHKSTPVDQTLDDSTIIILVDTGTCIHSRDP